MGGRHLLVIGSSFLHRYSHQLTAILTLVLTFGLALVANWGGLALGSPR